MAWGWACRFAARSSRHMKGGSGLRRTAPRAPSFNSSCPLTPRCLRAFLRRATQRRLQASTAGRQRSRSMVSGEGPLLLRRIAILLVFFGIPSAGTKSPERRVEANAILSERDPKVRIQLPKSVRYVGADRWVLYDIADCELHAFVEANE